MEGGRGLTGMLLARKFQGMSVFTVKSINKESSPFSSERVFKQKVPIARVHRKHTL